METFRLTGSDTIIINGNLITDSADGDIGTVVIDGNIANTVVGKNGNMIIAKDENGVLGTITLSIMDSRVLLIRRMYSMRLELCMGIMI